MGYALDLFSPETHAAFGASSRTISGFRKRQERAARRLAVGDKLLCYVTQVSRWVGILEVVSEPFEDASPIFVEKDDPFVVRIHVKPLVWLSVEDGVPIKDPTVWSRLEMTRDLDPAVPTWTGKVRTTLVPISNADGALIEQLLRQREANALRAFPISDDERKKLKQHVVQRVDGPVVVALPDDADEDDAIASVPVGELRESVKIQALLAIVGAEMGHRIWLPKNDRGGVMKEWKPEPGQLLDVLPLNYDDVTLQTIERIDVLWLRGRAIMRAFEVEHTTAIYSGILRMADLLALQPNMDIKLHIVAPTERREKVMAELRRPVFSLLERMPLSRACTFLDYDDVREIAGIPHLVHVSSTLLDDYAEMAE